MKIFVCLVLAVCVYGSQSGAVEMSKDESAELDSVEHGMWSFCIVFVSYFFWYFASSLHKFSYLFGTLLTFFVLPVIFDVMNEKLQCPIFKEGSLL